MKRMVCVTVGGLFAAVLVAGARAQQGAGVAAANPAPGCTAAGCHVQILRHARPHEPVSAGRCDACHLPKRGATAFQAGARHEFQRAGDNPGLCFACHDRLGAKKTAHGPVKMGVCVLCHDPHGSEHALLLRFDVDRQLCAQCHRITIDQGDHVHPPVNDGTCAACHDPHGSDYGKILRAASPELCLDCHDTIEELLDEAAVTHGAVTTGRSCLQCHDPHVSPRERLLVAEPMDLCLSCHDRELESEAGKIRNIAQQLKDNTDHHGPLRDGNCSACHNPHAGSVYRLLTEAYTPGPYAAFEEENYALCFGCHEVEMVEEERDDEATEFRNGDLNLHYVHVNREDKGCACAACHDPHAGTGPKHIADARAIGRQALLIKYEPSVTGGSCQTRCHEPWAYDRVKPVRKD